jgi:hypothetical protein
MASVSFNGSTLFIRDGGPFGTLSTNPAGESLTFNVASLNGALAAQGSGLQFAAGSGVSDNQSVATGASGSLLTSNGSLSVIPGTSGSLSMKIDVFKTDWTGASAGPETLYNSGSATFGFAPEGATLTYNSWYNNDNSDGGKLLGAGQQTYTSNGDPLNSPVGSPSDLTTAAINTFAVPFSLTNEVDVTLTAGSVPGESVQYQVQTAISDARLVPEPAGFALAAVACGGLALRAWRRLRSRNSLSTRS